MANLFESLEATAARGAEGLAAGARVRLAQALQTLRRPDGGFAGLDGQSDPYYTFFAWLALRALGAAYDRGQVCAYMAAHRRDANPVDARCAGLLLAAEGRESRLPWLGAAAALARGDTREIYGAFLLLMARGGVPRWAARLAWRRLRKLATAGGQPTPRLAAGGVLATLAGEDDVDSLFALASRCCSEGGFVSAPGAQPDLLATAAARFAWRFGSGCQGGALRAEDERLSARASSDLAFIEACWTEDGLFGASPLAERGDAEHTFYGLLALGTCRPAHS